MIHVGSDVIKAIGEISSVDLSLTWRSDLSSRKVDKVDWRVGPDKLEIFRSDCHVSIIGGSEIHIT